LFVLGIGPDGATVDGGVRIRCASRWWGSSDVGHCRGVRSDAPLSWTPSTRREIHFDPAMVRGPAGHVEHLTIGPIALLNGVPFDAGSTPRRSSRSTGSDPHGGRIGSGRAHVIRNQEPHGNGKSRFNDRNPLADPDEAGPCRRDQSAPRGSNRRFLSSRARASASGHRAVTDADTAAAERVFGVERIEFLFTVMAASSKISAVLPLRPLAEGLRGRGGCRSRRKEGDSRDWHLGGESLAVLDDLLLGPWKPG